MIMIMIMIIIMIIVIMIIVTIIITLIVLIIIIILILKIMAIPITRRVDIIGLMTQNRRLSKTMNTLMAMCSKTKHAKKT